MYLVASKDSPASSKRAQVAWWGDTYLICLAGMAGGVHALLTGEPLAATLPYFAMAVVCGCYALRERQAFRRGWRQGYESAVRVMLESSAGQVSDVEARAAVNGDPTPEPWEPHAPPRMRQARR